MVDICSFILYFLSYKCIKLYEGIYVKSCLNCIEIDWSKCKFLCVKNFYWFFLIYLIKKGIWLNSNEYIKRLVYVLGWNYFEWNVIFIER